ncbi:Parvulin-like peptidyl-prolyl isomerase [Congregibacter litoralis KT71]|uniref:peptidylprolyl isomerase n=2 Tax=Congregibacter TaxID=393661 RepID=A4AE69_9GAMM|nr:Parvulin-like peptidyl-prolyl isomerase [Congregibacter litoralis KT71]
MKRVLIAISALLSVAVFAADDAGVLIADSGVVITTEEFEAIYDTMPPSLKAKMRDDVAERLEIINSLLVARKLAAEADKITPSDDDYWTLHAALVGAKYEYMFKRLVSEVSEPDFEPLARERYVTQKDKYAFVPEVRASSHILLISPPGIDRTEVRAKAQGLLDQLRAGADFEAMVAEYSDDAGTRARKGSLGKYIRFGDPGITPPYSEALFEIENVGEYSEVTDSQFGVHIIRLDAVQESAYAEFDKVRDVIITEIKREFAGLARDEVRGRFSITDDLYINGELMEELLSSQE